MGCVGYMAQYQAIVWTVVSARSSLRLAVFLQYVLQRAALSALQNTAFIETNALDSSTPGNRTVTREEKGKIAGKHSCPCCC
jgi:hypothetical protein